MKEKILVICAHSDDEIVGMGGTLLKYKKQGKDILAIILSYGEKSRPHIKEEIVAKERVKETRKIDKLLNRRTVFLGLTEMKIKEDAERLNIKKRLKIVIKKYNPDKIFTLSERDPHPDHGATGELVLEVLNKMKYGGDVYTFGVWSLVEENKPCMYVDISSEFKRKLELLKLFESQKFVMLYPLWLFIYIRARLYGRKSKCKYAEKFYKIK